jgi:predicted RNA binding protein YcfA (HicA-like mRNA interferase family)
MSGLPVVSGRAAMSALRRVGYEVIRQKGSHVRLRHPDAARRKPVTVPDHRELKSGTLRAILRDADLSIDEFRALLAE